MRAFCFRPIALEFWRLLGASGIGLAWHAWVVRVYWPANKYRFVRASLCRIFWTLCADICARSVLVPPLRNFGGCWGNQALLAWYDEVIDGEISLLRRSVGSFELLNAGFKKTPYGDICARSSVVPPLHIWASGTGLVWA